ncbi:hypothetical protein ALC57_05096 [Trachymyrmex cornetzi]|uniref:Uncharacterized protein n=1 Tax=Trachymyrmex cornetzi TaxID=471704 RepID=A0A151JBY7_9HYME|nr:hypothetical protein ALC57_05096 [Trachymyrmex cornetzi]
MYVGNLTLRFGRINNLPILFFTSTARLSMSKSTVLNIFNLEYCVNRLISSLTTMTDNVDKLLPTNTQTVLSTSEDTLEKLATMADRIHNIVSTNVYMEVTSSATGTSSWDGQLSEIIKRLDRMELKHRKTSRRRERSGSRLRTKPTSASSGYCWYHKRFGR